MTMIPADDLPLIARYFEKSLEVPVTIDFFTHGDGHRPLPVPELLLGREMEGLLREVTALSPRLRLLVHDLEIEPDKAVQWGITRVPAVVLTGAAKGRVRFLGLPSGYEFAALIEGLVDVSRGATDLPAQAREEIASLDRVVHIQVFGTPACPHCPRAARTAHKLAVESSMITADLIEIGEFPDMAHRYRVAGVPKIVINETIEFMGAQPADVFLAAIRRAAGRPNP
jgi:glutaredoxin-like protein